MQSQNPIGQPFVQLPTVESTNNYAMQQVQAQMAGHGATWFAHEQTAGKGQRGKTWSMSADENLILSTVIEPKGLLLRDGFLLSAMVALACHDVFSAYAFSDTTIKWPNDLYWRDRKAGGILIENILLGKSWRYAIVGVGININQANFPGFLPNPVSLKQITGKSFDSVSLAKSLCNRLEERWQQLKENENGLLNDYVSHLYKLNQKVTFKKENASFEAIVRGVNKAGELLLFNGKDIAIPFGEWQWVIESPVR